MLQRVMSAWECSPLKVEKPTMVATRTATLNSTAKPMVKRSSHIE